MLGVRGCGTCVHMCMRMCGGDVHTYSHSHMHACMHAPFLSCPEEVAETQAVALPRPEREKRTYTSRISTAASSYLLPGIRRLHDGWSLIRASRPTTWVRFN